MAKVDPSNPNQVTEQGHAEEPQADIQKRAAEANQNRDGGDSPAPSLDPIADQPLPGQKKA